MILFTADWHIKLGQKNVPIDWSKNRYRMFFNQVHEIDCDLHIIGGDLFDRLPSLDELELYFEFIAGVVTPTIIFDGNHEATKKGKTFLVSLREATKRINSLVDIVVETSTISNYTSEKLGTCVDTNKNFSFGILPYCDLHKKGKILSLDPGLPLFTHVRGEIPPHVKPEIDLDVFNRFPVVFAGDLHSHSNCQRNIVYPGSPLTTSFHRNKVDTGYILIDEEDQSWSWHKFNLPQLIRKTVSSPDEMVPTDFDHTIYELEGDLQELASVSSSELLDKKVVKRSSDTALMLSPTMTLVEELAEYLSYILELEETKVNDIIGVFNDYAKTS